MGSSFDAVTQGDESYENLSQLAPDVTAAFVICVAVNKLLNQLISAAHGPYPADFVRAHVAVEQVPYTASLLFCDTYSAPSPYPLIKASTANQAPRRPLVFSEEVAMGDKAADMRPGKIVGCPGAVPSIKSQTAVRWCCGVELCVIACGRGIGRNACQSMQPSAATSEQNTIILILVTTFDILISPI